MVWHKTAKFKKLQKAWYKKLEQKGFQDIEHGDNLKLSTQRFVTRDGGAYANPTLIKAKVNYYSNCRKFLSDYKFKNKKEQRIFELHSDGISIRDIAQMTKISRRKVHDTLKKLVKVMNRNI